MDQALKEARKVASDSENGKIKNYEKKTNSYHFVQVCIESFGTWGKWVWISSKKL